MAYPLNGLKRPKSTKPRDRRISQAEIKKLCATFGVTPDTLPKTQAQRVGMAFLLALETAMRLGEITSLRWEQVYLKQKYCVLLDTKNGDTREVPLNNEACRIMCSFGEREEGPVVGVSSGVASSLFIRTRTQCKLENLTFHDTRHVAITRLAGKLPLLELARTAGHRDARSLMIYYNASASELASKLDAD